MKPYRKAQVIKTLFQSVAAGAKAWKGTVYRAVATEYANSRDLLSGEGTKHFGGRWTPPGSFATVHASLDIKTTISENLGTQQHYRLSPDARLPLTLVAIDVWLHKVLDVNDDRVLAELELTRQRLLRCRWRDSMDNGREALTQAVGRLAFEAGIEGLLVPSARIRKSINLIVFPKNLVKGSSLKIQNSDKLPPPIEIR